MVAECGRKGNGEEGEEKRGRKTGEKNEKEREGCPVRGALVPSRSWETREDRASQIGPKVLERSSAIAHVEIFFSRVWACHLASDELD
jgi:hypothetical protein